MKMFKKIFDLDPKEVEEFIKKEVEAQVKRNADGKDVSEYFKERDIDIRWYPASSEFYVQLEPKLQTKDYEHYYYKDSDKELTAGEYFRLAFDHFHYSFEEIFTKMTSTLSNE